VVKFHVVKIQEIFIALSIKTMVFKKKKCSKR